VISKKPLCEQHHLLFNCAAYLLIPTSLQNFLHTLISLSDLLGVNMALEDSFIFGQLSILPIKTTSLDSYQKLELKTCLQLLMT